MGSFSWQKSLVVISIAEFLAVAGFAFITPFLPLYVQHFGNFTENETAWWSGVAIGGGGLAMCLSAPIWGILSDRYGRRPMLLRALFGGVAVTALYILVTNVYAFIGLRILQGIFTGTVSAATALVVTLTPRGKVPLAMGLLMGTIYAANSVGPMIGGVLSDHFGYTVTFVVTSILLLGASLLVLFFTRENFQPPDKDQRASLKSTLRLAVSPGLFPLLLVITVLNMGPMIVSPIVTLVIHAMNSGGDTASAAGLAFALMGVLASISSFMMGRLHERMSLKNILVWSCLITGLLYLPPVWANSVPWVVITVGLTGLVVGGTIISSNSLINSSVPANLQGIAYGLAQSANALGRGVGPIIGGGLVPFIGLRPVFGVSAGILVIAALLSVVLLKKKERE